MRSMIHFAVVGLMTLAPIAPLMGQTLAPERGPYGSAQFCPEGTYKGQCVNPAVARAGRNAAIAFTQAQISITERPYPASSDTTYSYPNTVAAAPSIVTRQTLIGSFGTQGIFDRASRGE